MERRRIADGKTCLSKDLTYLCRQSAVPLSLHCSTSLSGANWLFHQFISRTFCLTKDVYTVYNIHRI
ncbi:hypothetical protein TREVI0001_2142 [Treponema vincentii ATCC 35580]|uniref:Uncharacterized protein n=1 Tax=Treponema vincentii ATCC 35580 TaxID=596324 RepID=C8PQN4_9SPIR|nr:hypothetical protein TREVI0001_2142 [Treponema vincentii ATCC 35580]